MSLSVIKCFDKRSGSQWVLSALLFLPICFYSYEYKWIDEQRVLKNYSTLNAFKNSCRYIDDLMANNDDRMINVMKDIYPKELVLVPDDSDGLSAPFFDLQLVITNGVVSTSIFDKRTASQMKTP